MDTVLKQELIDHLSQFVSENKRRLFDHVLAQRTRHITIALEDIYQSHNASATVRTCDCFGIQELHVIENRNHYTINPDVTLGSSKWVDLIRYNKLDHNNTPDCLNALKSRGYRLIATTPHAEGFTPSDIPIDTPLALLFGTEETGLTEVALEYADQFIRIPMYGFTESFNISVSVALILHDLVERLKKSEVKWELNDDEMLDIKLRWMRKVVRKHELIERQFLESRGFKL